MESYYPLKKVAQIFGDNNLKSVIEELEASGEISPSKRYRSGALLRSGWSKSQLSEIGSKVGFFKKLPSPVAIAVFTTKGGVLKSTLALNIARTAALNGHKTCVVGLDIQGDVTTALGYDFQFDRSNNLEEMIATLDQTKGLNDLFSGQVSLENIVHNIDLPNLFLIPETPELVALNDSLNNINRREFWLKEKVIEPLKNYFDVIIMDCSPNWNKLTTNALVSCDALVSPLECKINNFRNFKVFSHFLKEFKAEMHLNFENIFIPTKFSPSKKLSSDIFSWYQQNVEGCTTVGIKESVSAEEAMALNISILEHVGLKPLGKEFVDLMTQIHGRVELAVLNKTNNSTMDKRVLRAPNFSPNGAR